MNEQQMQAILQLVAQAMQGDEKATKAIQQIQLAAQQGDELATKLWPIIQQVMQLMQGAQIQSNKRGAKLNYLRKLTNQCAEDEELQYYKKGGVVCAKCAKKKAVKKACGGIPIKAKGGCSKAMEGIKLEMMLCGGKKKIAKKALGGEPYSGQPAPGTYEYDANLWRQGGYKDEDFIAKWKKLPNELKKGGKSKKIINKKQ